MLCDGVAACVYCTLCWMLTQHSAQYTHHTYDLLLPHQRMTYNDVVFTESLPK